MTANQTPVRVLLGGIGGYGNVYVNALLDHGAGHNAQLVGAADPAPQSCQRLDELKASGVPVLASLDEALATIPADLVVLSTPISLHAPHTCAALARGAHVLCEKPLCASTDDVHAMLAAPHTACVLAAQESATVSVFPASLVRSTSRGTSALVHVAGLAEALQRCYHRMALPSELGFAWASPGREIALAPLFKPLT